MARDVALLLLIAFSIGFNFYLLHRLKLYETTPLQLDEDSINRVEETTEAANKARKDLGHQVGVARVAIRDAQQATTNLRSAQTRGAGKKW